jgi:hypothetical protein
MRSPVLLFASILALAAACGGKTSGVGSGGGGGSSSGGASSSSGGGSGGGSGGSSGGSSSGGSYCSPLPGCNSETECPEPNGCGTCYCESSGWQCTGCGDDEIDAGPPDSSFGCPIDPPTAQTSCQSDGLSCSYGSAEGCGEGCDCYNNEWSCYADPCPPPTCPSSIPQDGTACFGQGDCYYSDGSGCGGADCYCGPSGSWSCAYSVCVDAGPPDSGPPDAGGCPGSLPPDGASCDVQGDVCTYLSACETNCLCTATGWVCASQGGC